MKSRRRSLRLPLVNQPHFATLGTLVLAAGAFISPVGAATQTLNVSGDWDTSSAIWDAGSVWSNGNSASFGAAASAIELVGDIQVAGISAANDLTFNNNTPGGSITFVEAAAITPSLGGGHDLTFNLAIGGTQGLNVDNAGGQVVLNAENAISGPITVTAGTLALGANGALNGIGSLNIETAGTFISSGVNQIGTVTVTNAGVLSLGGNDTVAAYVSNAGTLTGSGTLRASTYDLNDSSVVNSDLGNGVINTNDNVALNGNTGTNGALNVQSGITTVAANVGATTLAVSTGATLTTTATGNLADTATLTLSGTGALDLGHNETIGNLAGAGSVNLGANTLTLSNGSGATSTAIIDGSGGLSLQAGTQTLAGANTYTGATNVNGGTLALTGTLTGTTVNVASGAALTSTGGLADGTNLNLTGTSTLTLTGAETLASLNAGTGAINANGVDLTVTGNLTSAGTLNVRDLAVGNLNGSATIASTGTVTASAGGFGGNITSGTLVKDTAGTLTLSTSQAFTGGTSVTDGTLVLGHAFNTLADAGALTVDSGATVDLQANNDTVATFTSNGGTLAGAGTLTAATYALNNGSTINANLGAGALTTNGNVALNGDAAAANFTIESGVTTLDGNASASTVNVTGGSLDIAANGSLSAVTALAVSPGATLSTSANEQINDTAAVTNNGTLSIGGAETVGSLNNTGTIAGAGTLTTDIYNLGTGSNITGNLGAGSVNVTGNTNIAGTSAADVVSVTAGTLALTGNNLADTAVVTNTSTISLSGDDTISTLNNTGTIAGVGTLTATEYNLNTGSNITGNLGTGAVNILGATTISGTADATTVDISAGQTLTLTGNNLADTTAVVINSASTLNMQGNDTIGSLVNNAGTLGGFGTLTASSYTLNDGTTLDANLGNGDIFTNGTVVINGLTGGGGFTVQSGTTSLTNTSGATAVTVADDSSLILNADGELNVATAINIGNDASLVTGGVNQIGNATLTNAGTLTLGGNDTVGAYVSNGGLYNGGFKLTALTYALNDGTVIDSDLGTGELTANGNVTINANTDAGIFNVQSGATTMDGMAAATDVNVTGGSLTLTAASSFNAATTLDISNDATLTIGSSDQIGDAAVVTNAGTLDMGAHDDTVAAFTSNGGALLGTGTLTAATYALNGGTTVDVNLGDGDITTNGTVAVNGTTGAGALLVESGETSLAKTSGATSVNLTGGALTLAAASSLQDAATIALSGGTTLTTGGDEQLANNATVASDGTIILGGDETIASLAGTGVVSLGANDLTLSNAAGTSSAAVISGTGGLTLQAGTQTLSGASTYTGTTTLESGTLTIDGTNASDHLAINGGTLALNATSAASTADIAAGATLVTGAADRLDNFVVIHNDGIISLGGNETLGALTGTGDVNLGAFNLTFAGDGDNVSGELISDFAGSISSTGTITKTGNDIQILSGSSNYSGIAYVNDGILRITNAEALGIPGAPGGNARTEVSGTGTLEVSGSITLGEVIRPTAVGYAATFTGNDAYLTNLGAINNHDGINTLSGQIGIISGVPDVVIGASSGTLNLTGDIIRASGPTPTVSQLTFQAAEGATIVLTGANVGLQLGDIVDLQKTGGGTLDISNIIDNTSSGDLLLHDGTVKVSAAANLGGSAVRFGDTNRGTLEVVSSANQPAVVVGVGEVISGGDGTFADFSGTIFDFTNGDGTLRAEADTMVSLANLQNFAGHNFIKDGTADLLIDVRGGALAKSLSALVINNGNVFFLAEAAASLELGSLDGTGGNLSFGSLDAVINQTTSGIYGGALDGSGNLTINTTSAATLFTSGVLSNFASVTIDGDGTGGVTLAGDSTYTGPTHVTGGGDLTITGTLLSATLDIAAGGNASLTASDRLDDAAAIVNAGTLDLAGNSDTVGSFTSTGGTLAGTGTLTAATYTLNAGTVIDANLGDGDAAVSGLVRLNGNTGTGTFTVLDGGELRGVGANIGGDLVVDVGGTLAPGASPGVTNIAGNWTQNGTFAAELAGLGGAGAPNGHDQVIVGGTITLGPVSTLAIQRDGGYTEPALGDTFRIIVGDLTGQQFANVTTQFSTGLVLDLADGTLIGTGLTSTTPSGSVDLTTLPGLDANSIAMVTAMQADAFAPDANGVQINSTSGAAVPAGQAVRALLTSPLGSTSGFNKLSPESYAGDSAYAVLASRSYAEAALRTAPVARVGNVTIFTAFSAHNAGTDSSVNAADYDLNGSGGLLGGRLAVGERASVGIFGAFDSGEIKSTYRKGDVTGQVFGAFADLALNDAWTLTGTVTLGNYDVDSTRSSFSAPSATAAGVNTTSTGVSLGLAYEMVRTQTGGFSPYVEFNYMTAKTDGFTETGSTDSLAVSSIDYTSIVGELGGRGYVMIGDRVSLQAHLAVAQEFGDDDTSVTARLASGGTAFTVVSPGFGSTAIKAGVGADYAITNNFTLSAGVEAAISADATTGTTFRIGGGLSF